jgi:hypothetical protein
VQWFLSSERAQQDEELCTALLSSSHQKERLRGLVVESFTRSLLAVLENPSETVLPELKWRLQLALGIKVPSEVRLILSAHYEYICCVFVHGSANPNR